jgi:uncharacterized membrane protein YraQ (UPF0718 family)
MVKKRRDLKMLLPTIIMALLALILLIVGYLKGDNSQMTGMKIGMEMTLQILPLLIFAFLVAGMVQVLIPADMISKWVGQESGWRGIILGTLTGAIAPGGPYVSLPIAAALVKSGAGVGTMIAFVTGWSLWALNRIPMEIGILGWKFSAVRLLSTFFFPPIAGLIAQFFFGGVKL